LHCRAIGIIFGLGPQPPYANGHSGGSIYTDGAIARRDNAQALVTSNYTLATPAFFVNAPGGDLHLVSSASQAIDKGVALQAVANDRDGEPRPSGAAPDLGADEYQVTAPPPPVLAAPGNLQATAVNGSVQLTWVDQSSGETEFVLERARDKRDSFAVLTGVSADTTSYADTGLSRGWYRYRVRAFSSATGQYSPYSNVVEIRVR
jgi:hypothetical protein